MYRKHNTYLMTPDQLKELIIKANEKELSSLERIAESIRESRELLMKNISMTERLKHSKSCLKVLEPNRK